MSDANCSNQQASTRPRSSEHEDRIERLQQPFYIRWTSGPDYERAYLCLEDGEPDMLDFACVSFGMARLFKEGMAAMALIAPTPPPSPQEAGAPTTQQGEA